MRLRVFTAAAAVGALVLGGTAACGSGSDSNTIKVAYQRSTDAGNRVMDNFLTDAKKQFEKANPGKKVQLIPIQASENDYYTKLDLMMKSPRTAPDLAYEDTFLINSDIKAGFLSPIDEKVKGWKDWDQFQDTAKGSVKGQDGKLYGVPDGTDTRGIFYNKKVFAKAGLPADWQPKNWDDLMTAAKAIKAKVPGTAPMFLTTGKANGEASVMQGFEMLLYGTKDQLYNPEQKKWVQGSTGFKDSLQFTHDVYSQGLGLPVSQAVDPNMRAQVYDSLLPQDKLGFTIDGNFGASAWQKGGSHPWPNWDQSIGWTAMPTQHGEAPGKTSMSGGWSWSLTRQSKNQDLAFDFIKGALQTKENAVKYDNASQNIAVRKDVAADKSYQSSAPDVKFFTDLVQYTHYRPALPEYPKVSSSVADAMETVTTSTDAGSIAQAQTAYDSALKDTVSGKVTKESGKKK